MAVLLCSFVVDDVVALVLLGQISVSTPGWPGTQYVDQAGLCLASAVLKLKVCATTSSVLWF